MSDLFNVLDGIINSDYCDSTLANTEAIATYAESCGITITQEEAKRIANVGRHWLSEQESGNGEWDRMRHDAQKSLED